MMARVWTSRLHRRDFAGYVPPSRKSNVRAVTGRKIVVMGNGIEPC